mgnify:CR=1 FL=1
MTGPGGPPASSTQKAPTYNESQDMDFEMIQPTIPTGTSVPGFVAQTPCDTVEDDWNIIKPISIDSVMEDTLDKETIDPPFSTALSARK